MGSYHALGKNLTNRQRDRRLRLGVILAVLVIGGGIPLTITLVDHADWLTNPAARLWNATPVWIQDAVVNFGSWFLVAILILAIAFMTLRLRQHWQARPSTSLTPTKFIAGGTYGLFLKRFLRNSDGMSKRRFSAIVVTPVENQQRDVDIRRARPMQPLIREATVKKGTDSESSAAYHVRASRVYAPWVKEGLRGFRGILIPVVSFGGQTSLNVAARMAGQLRFDGTCVPLLTGNTPKALNDAMADPDAYARARAYARQWQPLPLSSDDHHG